MPLNITHHLKALAYFDITHHIKYMFAGLKLRALAGLTLSQHHSRRRLLFSQELKRESAETTDMVITTLPDTTQH
jgi:hypothetical protein